MAKNAKYIKKPRKRESLKPCPFCGKEAKIDSYKSSMSSHLWWDIKCKGCGMRIYPQKTKRKAIKVWNRRVGL